MCQCGRLVGRIADRASHSSRARKGALGQLSNRLPLLFLTVNTSLDFYDKYPGSVRIWVLRSVALSAPALRFAEHCAKPLEASPPPVLVDHLFS